jgi:hypothetical protein
MCVRIKSHQTSNRPQIGISSGVCVQLVRYVFVRYIIQDGTEILVMQERPLLTEIFRLTYILSSNTISFTVHWTLKPVRQDIAVMHIYHVDTNVTVIP